MHSSPRSAIGLLVACLVLVGVAAFEHSPGQQQPERTHAVHAPSRTR